MKAPESSPPPYKTEVLDHLGLVAGMCKELNIANLIDEQIPCNSPDKILSTGNAIVGLILNGLGFVNKRLYLVPHFFKNKPVSKLLGVNYLKSEHFNDDALGRSLDAVYKYGVSNLYALISSHVIRHLSNTYGLSLESGQLDNTTFHLHGSDKTIVAPDGEVLHITQGYSKDHRPDLVQIGLQLIVEHQSRIPLLMKILSGNEPEGRSYGAFIKTYTKQLKQDYGLDLIVVDSKLYNQDNIEILGANGDLNWVTRVPHNLTVVKDLISHLDRSTMLPLAGYEQYTYQVVGSNYGSVKQRWLVLYNQDKYVRDLKQLNKTVRKKTDAAAKDYKQLSKQLFPTEEVALKAIQAFSKKLKFNRLVDTKISIRKHYNSVGKPKKGQIPTSLSYKIKGQLVTNEVQYEIEKSKLGYLILATNQLDENQISPTELLQHYKNQSTVERSFRFLKDPSIVSSSLFVQKPERMVAIMMVMTLCLLVYAALEFVTRTLLKKNNLTFDNQVGKPIQNPTMRWIFECFQGIHILHIADSQQIVLNLEDQHLRIIKLLGKNYLMFYT